MPDLADMPARRLRFRLAVSAVAASTSLALAALGIAACSDDTTGSAAETEAGGNPGRTEAGPGTGEDSATPIDDAAPDANDAGTDAKDANVRDANGPGEAGTECNFNHDCQSALRCDCADFPCTCKAGARGTGRNGIDPCTDPNQCASSLCIEGPPDSGDFCSDECTTNADCTGKLPLCTLVPFLGAKVCIRTPPPK